jgi:hypothetical protein
MLTNCFFLLPGERYRLLRASGLIFSSETTWPNGTKLGSKHLCKVLYQEMQVLIDQTRGSAH